MRGILRTFNKILYGFNVFVIQNECRKKLITIMFYGICELRYSIKFFIFQLIQAFCLEIFNEIKEKSLNWQNEFS